MKIINILIFGFLILLFAGLVGGMANPAPPYCERMDYNVINETICDFGDGNSCEVWEFFRGECGAEYIKELPCVKLGESVFSHEKCCAGGYVYAPYRLIGQASCQPLSKVIIGKFKYNPYYWLGILIILGIIGYLIYKTKKKK